MTRLAMLLLLATACGAPSGLQPAPRAEAEPVAVAAARVPGRADLVCFPCHSHVRFERGPRFAHGTSGHRGHCHLCHQGEGHHGQEIDKTSCLSCHQDGSSELGILASR